MTIVTTTKCQLFQKKDRKVFVNRNLNVVPLHRQNTAPTCERKNSHVWPQKNINYQLSIIDEYKQNHKRDYTFDF